MSKSKSRPTSLEAKAKRKKRKRNIRIILFVIGVALFYFFIKSTYGIITNPQQDSHLEMETAARPQFMELECPDSLKLQAILMIGQPTMIKNIAKHYYGNERYWPFILEANKDKIGNILDIQPETILEIPRIDSIKNKGETGLLVADELGQKLLEEINKKNEIESQPLVPGM
ncbi:MAG: LysM peptidoglycan-binding domain-containing protein [Dysgonomonas sp.]